jgi:hypothetical protein
MEYLEVRGGQVIDAVRKLIYEGNIRKVIVKRDGQVIAEFPLTFGVVGVAVAPALAAIGAIAALVTDCAIDVEREPVPPAP